MGRVAKYVYLHLDINRVSQIDVAVIAKIHDIKELLARGRVEPDAVFPELKRLAASDQWQTREVAATALVELGKRHPTAVLDTARRWSKDHDAKIRRAASEGLRGIVKVDPQAVRPVLETLRTDPELYVKKSVANVLRNASGKHPEFVLASVGTGRVRVIRTALHKKSRSLSSLCNLCVLCVSVVDEFRVNPHHRDTEDTEVAQRNPRTRTFCAKPIRHWMDREGGVEKAQGLTSPRRCGDLGDTGQELLTVGATHSASDPSKPEFVVARTIRETFVNQRSRRNVISALSSSVNDSPVSLSPGCLNSKIVCRKLKGEATQLRSLWC